MITETFDEKTQSLVDQARALTEGGEANIDKAIEAWRKVVQAAPDKRGPRGQLAQLYRRAARWNALVEVLKEAHEKLGTADDVRAERLSVLHEMVEVYRDQLHLDAMVISTYNQILALDTGNEAAVEALCAQYERMKRWPDLIGLLQKRAQAPGTARDQRITLGLRVAGLFIERFSNQSEAIKAYEGVLELDPSNDAALGALNGMYEKRRDWEKLIAVLKREAERLPAADVAGRLARAVEIAKLAGDKLRKPSVSMQLWGEVLALDEKAGPTAAGAEALAELEKLYEREKDWARLADVLEQQAARADAAAQAAVLGKLGLLYTEKLKEPTRAAASWKKLLESDANNRRAQDALKKLYLESRSWDELEAYYAQYGKFDELVRTLERQAESEDRDTQIDLQFRIARLYQDKLGKADRAVRAYERVLSVDAGNERAARALVPLYEAAGDARKLAGVLEIELGGVQDAGARRPRLERLATLAEQQLKDKGAAFGFWLRAFKEGDGGDAVRAAVERLAGETGLWADLVEAYEGAAASARGDDLVALLRTIAKAYEDELGDAERALAANLRITTALERDPSALAALERLYLKLGQFAELLSTYEKRLAIVDSAAERRDIRYKVAQLHEEEMGDSARAIEAYQAILEDAAGPELAALRALDRIYSSAGRHGDLAKILERELAALDPASVDEKIELKLRLGLLRKKDLADATGAIAVLSEILTIEPAHDDAREALRTYLSDPAHQLDVAATLEPIFERLEQWGRLVETLEIQLGHETARERRVELLLRIGEVNAQRIGDGTLAFSAYSRAFREDPENERARAELERLAAIQETWRELVHLYERAVDGADSGRAGWAGPLSATLERSLLMQIAALYDERLENTDRAVAALRRAQALEPDDKAALDALERLFLHNEQWSDLLEVYRKKVELVRDAAEREALRFKIATLQEEILGQPDDAIVTFNEILAEAVGHAGDLPMDAERQASSGLVRSLRALDRLYEAQQQWHELADVLTKQLEVFEKAADGDDERVVLLDRLGALRESKLGEVAAAVDTYQRVLQLRAEDPVAREALERLVRRPDQELQVAQILEPLYKGDAERNPDALPKLIGIHEILAKHALDPARRIELLLEIGRLHELGGDDTSAAFDAYARALRVDASNPETQGRIDRLARILDRWSDLVATYESLANETSPSEEDQAIALWTKAARLWVDELRDDERAVAAYRNVLAIQPRHLDAITALETLFGRTGDYERLVEITLTKADVVGEPGAKRELYAHAAKMLEEVLDQPERAVGAYQQILAHDACDAHALDALVRLYLRLERWADLRGVYAKQAELASHLADKKRIYHMLGRLQVEALDDSERAIATYTTLLDLDPDDQEAIGALDRLYGEAGRHYEQLQVLERAQALSRATSDAVQLRHRIGALWEQQLHDLAKAVEAYRDVLSMDAMHEPTLGALDRVLRGEGEPVAAANVLAPIYQAAGEWERLVEVFEVLVQHEPDKARRIELDHEIARICERRLENSRAAFDAEARALREDPAEGRTVADLERLAEATRAWEDLARLYEQVSATQADPAIKVELLMRAARIEEEELSDVDRAISTLRRVLENDPDQRAAVVSLDRLYETQQRWSDLAGILQHAVRLATDERHIVELTFRLGQTFERNLGDLDQAIACYRQILAADATHQATVAALEFLFAEGQRQLEIAEILEPLYRAAEQWERLVRIHEVHLQQTTEPATRLGLIERLAELTEHRLVDQIAAFHWWGMAVREQPESERAGDELERLARATHSWEELEKVYGDVLELAASDEVRRNALLKLGRVFEEELRDPDRAEQAYLGVLEITELDPDALRALDRLYTARGAFAELAAILRKRLAVEASTADVVALHFRLGALFEEALDEPEQSIESYQAILQEESRNARALEALERVYFKREQWADLYKIYEQMVDIAVGDEQMAECYARMAKIAGDTLDEQDKAIELWGRVTDLRGEDPTALEALADLYERSEMWRELVDVLDRHARIVSADGNADAEIVVRKRMGRIWGEQLSRERNALEAWQRVLELDPNDLDGLQAMLAIYRATQAYQDLSDTLKRTIEVALLGFGRDEGRPGLSDPEIADLYCELGALESDVLLRLDEAISAYRKVLEIEAHDARALGALETLYRREMRFEDVIWVLERKAEATGDQAERIDLLLQAAGLWGDPLGESGRAARVYEKVLGMDAGNLTASLALEQIYRDDGQWERVVELLLSRVEHADTADGRIEILQAIAKIYETKMGSTEEAFVILQAAFREDYSNDSTARELERLASQTGKWSELLTEYTGMVRTIPEPRVAADLWVKIGGWYGDELGHLDYAIQSAQQALGLVPDHAGALRALGGFFRRANRWPELATVLARHAEVEEDGDRKVETLLSLAELWESQLGDERNAITCYQQAVAAEPRCLPAMSALERLFRRREAWDQLVDVLGQRAAVVEDVEDANKIRQTIGDLYESRLGDDQRAIDTYRDILTTDPHHGPTLRALEKLYERTAAWAQLLEVLEQQLEAAREDASRISLYERMAEVWEQQFSKSDRAAECFEKVLELDPRRDSAYRALERLYATERRWDLLVDIYRRHLAETTDPMTRVELLRYIGRVYEGELRSPENAIEAYQDALGVDPDDSEALAALGRLFEQVEEWHRAIDAMDRLVRITDDATARVEMHYRIGRIMYERLGGEQADLAETRFAEALSLDPAHMPTMLALIKIYDKRGDYQKSAQMRVRAEAHTQNTIEKARLLREAADLYRTRLEDESQAAELYARTLEIDPELADAGEPLAEIYFREERWPELEPILDMLVRKADKRDHRELNRLYFRLARTADSLSMEAPEKREKALKYYKLAYDLDSTHLPTLIGRASLLYRIEDWDGAFKIYQTILVHHRESQKKDEIVDIFYRLGTIKLKLGERKKALNMYEKALEENAHHRLTLEAIIGLQTQQSDWEAVISAKRAIAEIAEEPERFRLLEEIGDFYKEKLQNPQKAIAAFTDALTLQPRNFPMLHKTLELYTETKQWKRAIEVLLRVTELEKDAARRSKYLYTAAVISRDEMKALDEAIDFFNQALDENAELLKSFEAIDRICTQKKDWKLQERNYRKMIKRLTPEAGLQDLAPERRTTLIALWHALGEIYRSRLRNFQSASQAFEVAAQLEPENLTRHEILAELYLAPGVEQYDKAIASHHTLIKHKWDNIESYKALRRIYMDTRQYDKAWCVCQALTFLRRADQEEAAFYEQYKPRGFARARQRLTDELWWKCIFHPDEDRFIGAILGALWHPVGTMIAQPHKMFDLKRKDKVDLATSQLLFGKVFYYAQQVLNVMPQLELFLKPDRPGGLLLANTQEKGVFVPSFVACQDLLQGRPEKELAYVIGNMLSFMRSEHYLKLAIPTISELKVLFLAGLKLVNKNFPVKGDAIVIEQTAERMAREMDSRVLEQLAMVVQRFVSVRAEADLHKFARCVDLTGMRAGFVLCNDLETAARMVSAEPVPVGGLQPKDKIRELVLYSISEEYYAVREHLGFLVAQ